MRSRCSTVVFTISILAFWVKHCLFIFKPLVIPNVHIYSTSTGEIHQLFMACADAGIGIIGIEEHRLITPNPTDKLWSVDRNWVLLFSSATKQKHGGVGLLMSKHIHRCLQSVEAVSERILFATLHGNPQLSTTVVYAPTECSTSSDKEDFYSSPSDMWPA
jgi:hypothetical protein